MVATDGSATYVIFLYGEMETGEYDPPSEANIGFDAGDGKHGYNLPYGRNETNLLSTSNVGQPGTFLFRVDQNEIDDFIDKGKEKLSHIVYLHNNVFAHGTVTN